MRSLLNGFKVLICAVLVHSLVHLPMGRLPAELRSEAEAAMAPGADMPGFGGQTAPPRMLIIMDTSKSMASTPDMTKTMPYQDYDGQPDGVMSPPICGEDPNTTLLPNSAGLSSVVGVPNQNTGAMEGSTLNLSCAPGETIVQIDWAAYGKRTNTFTGGTATTAAVSNFPSAACAMPTLAGGMRDTTALDSAGACNDALSTTQWVAGTGAYRGWIDVTATIANRCVGLETCSVPVNNTALGGDPCSGTGTNGKYALATFRCSADPCPPNSGSKFCIAKKALHRIVSDNASNTLEMAAGGYFQTQWEKYHAAQNTSYLTRCAYDVIAQTTTTLNNNYLRLSGDEDIGPAPVPNTPAGTVTFSCKPETFTNVVAFDPSGPALPDPAYPGWCTAQPADHTCTKRFTEVSDMNRFQHDDLPTRSVKPAGGPGSWAWGAGPQPVDRLTDTPKHYFSNANSNWDMNPANVLTVVPPVAVMCSAMPPTFEDVPNAVPAGATYPASCTAGATGNACTFFNTNNSAMQDIQQTSIYFNAGPAPQVVRGITRTVVTGPTRQTGNIYLSELVPAAPTCPATYQYTGPNWAPCGPGDDKCDLTRVGSDVPNISYHCAPGYTLDGATNTCKATRVANNPNVVSAPFITPDLSTEVWSAPRYYTLSLASVAAGEARCFDGQTDTWTATRFPLATSGLLSFVNGLPCTNNDTSFGGRCRIRGGPEMSDFPGGPIHGVVNTDAQTVTCSIQTYSVEYKDEVPATPKPYCTFDRYRYDWNNVEQRCIYQRFVYNYVKRSFTYTWPYNNGDYAGSFMNSAVYPSNTTATDAFCTNVPVAQVNPSHTDATGFVTTSPVTCPAELPRGVQGCPADADRCKLRWNGPGSNRFTYFKPSPGASFGHPALGGAQPRIGCAVGDKEPQAGPDPLNLNYHGYKNDWSSWCNTHARTRPYTPASYDAPRLIADLYAPAVAGTNFTGSYWGGEVPNAADRFTPALHATKDRGLSVSNIFPPTPAISFSEFGAAKLDLLKLFKKHGAGGGTTGFQMPELGNITPLTGALKNALAFLTQTKLADPSQSCRRYSILLVTDGNEDPVVTNGLNDIVTDAATAGVDIYVVGFGIQSSVLDNFTRQLRTAVDATGHPDNVNGHAYNASDYVTLLNALNLIIGQQLSGTYSRSKPALTSDSKRLYAGYFSHSTGGADAGALLEYQGFVDAFSISNLGAISALPEWKFDQQLQAQSGTPPRRVITRTPSSTTLSDFNTVAGCGGTSGDMVDGMLGAGTCAAQMATANEIIEFVRNDATGTHVGKFSDGSIKMSRVSDVYHSQPVSMYAPFFSAAYTAPAPFKQLGGRGPSLDPTGAGGDFDSSLFTASYAAFKATNATREATVFVGSNTGTIHAIRDDVATVQTWRGNERWAYVPRQLLPKLAAARNGHTWLADGSFALTEVCFGQTLCEGGSGTGWKSILISATGRGGPFLSALDVSDAANPIWMWDYNANPASLQDANLGETWSAPVIARVRVDNDYYRWGAFMGGGFSDNPGNPADSFYVLDIDPAHNPSFATSHEVLPMVDSAATSARFPVAGSNDVMVAALATAVPNNVPSRPRVVRPNDGSRASRVYFGDTNGVLWQMDVTSPVIANWAPHQLFNPFKMDVVNATASNPASCRTVINPLPDKPVATPVVTMDASPLPSLPTPNLTLPGIYNRPYLGLDDNTSATLLYVGTGDSTNPLDMNTTNYFWAIEDTVSLETGSATSCTGTMRWAYYLDRTVGEKVLSEPVIIGKNIIVAVYTPPSSSVSVCGAAGSSILYCFDRLNGSPQNCLVDLSTTPIDPTAAALGGHARYVKVGSPGIVSDLQAVGNKVVFTTSASPDRPEGIEATDTNAPFRIRSWRRVR